MNEILSKKQLEIFKLLRDGFSIQEIAEIELSNDTMIKSIKQGKIAEKDNKEELEKKKSYIRKVKSVIKKKLENEFQKIAKSLRLDLDLSQVAGDTGRTGLMFGFDWVHNTKVYLFFTEKEGIIVWYEHECSPRCTEMCEMTLNSIIDERRIVLPANGTKDSNLSKFRLLIEEIKRKSDYDDR